MLSLLDGPCGSLALVVALLLPSAPQATEVLTEELPDGRRIEREVRADATGAQVLHGRYREWHANGQLACEGKYRDDERQDEWSFWFENGQLEARGSYEADVIRGRWDYWHPNGQKAGEGYYKDGLRNSKWLHWEPDGSFDKTESGEYEAELGHHPNGRLAFAGERKGKYRHGRWRWWTDDGRLIAAGHYQRGRRKKGWRSFWLPTGRPQVEGAYERDERSGEWRFWHADGTLDPEFLSGRWEDDERVAPLSIQELAPLDLGQLPVLPTPPGLTPAKQVEIERALDAFLSGGPDEREEIAYALWSHEYECVPATLSALASLDLDDEDALAAGAALEEFVLGELFGGHVFGWVTGADAESIRANRLTILRWFSWWSLVHDRPDYLAGLLDEEPEQVPSERLLNPPTPAPEPLARPATGELRLTRLSRRDRQRLVRERGGVGTEKVLRRALDWLACQQDEDGAWRVSLEEEDAGPVPSVGLTALALLAFSGDGQTSGAGEHADVVARGLDWLRSIQREDGAFEDAHADPLVPAQALAVAALAEACLASGDAALRPTLEAGVAYLEAQRHPDGGWHARGPDVDREDTLTTVWAATALHAAERAGLACSPDYRQAVLTSVNRRTDPSTGGVDYAGPVDMELRGVEAIDAAARAELTDPYPLWAEPPGAQSLATTGAGLFARCLLGQTSRRVPLIRHHALLLDEHPPAPELATSDPWHWYFGSYALFQVGGERWDRWAAALREAATASQTVAPGEASHGSWDPAGTFGHGGGRVFATAVVALTLEVYHRFPRWDG